MSTEPEINVRQMTYHVVVPQEFIDDALPPWDVMMERIEANARAIAALPLEEQKRITAERKAAYEAQRCTACGCHPDEHADC